MMNFENQTMLTLDFWKDKVCYMGHTLPTGTLGCLALNVPEETLAALDPVAKMLNTILEMPHLTKEVILSTKDLILREMDLLKSYPPLCYMEWKKCVQSLDGYYAPESVDSLIGFVDKLPAYRTGTPMQPEHIQGFQFSQLLIFAWTLPEGLKFHKERLLPFAENLNAGGRSVENYTAAFEKSYPLRAAYDLTDSAWLSISNISVQHIVLDVPEKEKKQLAMRMLCGSFAGMFRHDLFEGLRVGHAPKKCPVCGKWFLTTDARNTKYCNGLAPNDPKGRTCRQYANWVFRDQRERTKDDPIHITCDRLINNIDQRLSRGKLDSDAALKLKDMAKRKKERAYENHEYAVGYYKEEMTISALIAEVGL